MPWITCRTCGTDKLPDDFRNRSAPNEHLKYKTCRSCENGAASSWAKTSGRNQRKVLWNYGLTPDQYNLMLAEQDGVCKICKQPPGDRAFSVDHDHSCCSTRPTCGECTRGLLCDMCNKGLGMFRDNPALLVSAAHYLNRGGE